MSNDESETVEIDMTVGDAQDLSVLSYQTLAEAVADAVGEPKTGAFPESVRIRGTLEVVPAERDSDV
ncbi:hypothetical protein [Natrinema versiforme]|uniref:hypothetical protein n=1 Tax=Natrinema versiforme TaxID=88724 RepID=UPI00126944A2|nr:hypothetical protein [Natrinema versiforme]